MPHLPLKTEPDVQIIPLYPEVQIIPIKSPEPSFPSEAVPVLIIELGRATKALDIPHGAEWIVEQAVGDSEELNRDEMKKRTV
jgi:hypothetical protein